MGKSINIALAQLNPRLRETEANVETVRRIVAAHPGADLIAFPELFLSGYTVIDVEEIAVRANGPELKTLSDIARENSTALVVGASEYVSDEVANSALCLNERGDVVAVYRKVQLYGGDESEAFVAGQELLIVELCGLKVGLMICFDVEFPEVARALAVAGAEMFVTISANMEPFGYDHAVFVAARALENGLPHAYVNQVGPGESNLLFTGGSTVVSPDGGVLARAGPSGEVVLNARLSLPMKSTLREDYLSQLRSPLPAVRNLPADKGSKARV